MLLLIILLPLFSFFSGSLFGRFLGIGVCYITTISVFFSFILSLYFFFDIVFNDVTYKLIVGSWIIVDSLFITWGFNFDSLTVVMLLVVTFISTFVHLYSTEYMEYDPHLPRFMSYLSLFTFFMLILVTANNFLQLFVGWEGVGLSSYLLINFWFTRIQANKAAIKAMLVNRVGDFALLLAIFTIYFIFNTLDFDTIFALVPLSQNYTILIGSFKICIVDLICFLLFIGAMGKSAQLGLHTWLPDAMEGPTPVSALIHAATMVTAGVFLLARCSYLFEFSPLVLNFVVFIGSTTSFFAATTGLFQNDMKRVIAYSTCSQLGYMIFACGLSCYEVGVFHLSNHAFFKALLFLGAGSVIHAVSDEQDMRKLGGLKNLLPLSYSAILIGSLALIGTPFLTGFFSKDTILEVAYAKYTFWGHFSYFFGTFSAFCTAFYSVRLLFLVFLSEPIGSKVIIFNAHEGGWRLGLPLFFLSILSILIGFLSRDLFIGFGTDFWAASIFVLPDNYLLCDIEFLDLFFKLLPLFITILGSVFSFILYSYNLPSFFKIKKTSFYKFFFNFFNRKWYFDKIYNQFISKNSLYVSYFHTYKYIDRGLIENFGPSGILHSIVYLFNTLKNLQSGFLFHYLFIFSIFIVLFHLCYLIFWFFIPSMLILKFLILFFLFFLTYIIF
jgi:proton-translocating NADH-quinone oxidoreductase chain L